MKPSQVTGRVKSVNQNTLVLLVFAEPHAKSTIFALNVKTKVTGKLAPNSRVTVYYHMGNKKFIADRIAVWKNGPPEQIEPHKQPPTGGAVKLIEPNNPSENAARAEGSGAKASAAKPAAKAADKKTSVVPKLIKPEKPPERN